MNPLGHPAENVPLQGRFDRLPGLLGESTAIPYTTLNVTPEPPKDHIIWSLCCFLYSNPCCLGLAALIFSIKARDRKVAGDLEGARHYGSTARCLNIWATVLVSSTVLITIITIIIVLVQVNKVIRERSGYSPYDFNYRG